MKRSLWWVIAAIAVAVIILIGISMPPARVTLSSSSDGTLRGILHVHTNRSDGRSSPDQVAAIAAQAGLKFLVFTDHGDATRQPDPPAYRSGVLCLDGVEISTTAGHYIAIGMAAAPYPLGGEPRTVVEDVRRLGGFGIAAHPDSPRRELRWDDWDLPIDALEIFNPDTEWRAHLQRPGFQPKFTLLTALGTYVFRPGETIAHLFEYSPEIIRTWMSLVDRRRVVALAGVDAHAKLPLRDVEPGDNSLTLPFPGYRAAFSTLSVHVRPEHPLTGEASADAESLLNGLRSGHLHISFDARAEPASFALTGSNKQGSALEGDELEFVGPLTLHVTSNAPSDAKTTIFNGVEVVAERLTGTELTVQGAPGAYRAEIRLSGPGEPLWVVSNPIYVRERRETPGNSTSGNVAPTVRSGETAALFPTPVFGWSVEHDTNSHADLIASPSQMIFRFTLGADASTRPRVALVAVPHSLPPNDRLTFSMRADTPMRISVQMRTSGGERWQRSVYIDTADRPQTVRFDDFTPVGATRTEHPVIEDTPSILFVIETTNAKAGTTGQLTITHVTLER